MCEASHMKFDPVCHQISQVYMYENVTSGPSQLKSVEQCSEYLLGLVEVGIDMWLCLVHCH